MYSPNHLNKTERFANGFKRHAWRMFVFVLTALAVSIFSVTLVSAARLYAPTISAIKTDAFIGGDGDGKADPGETIEYTTVISASVEAANDVAFTDTIDSNTTLVGGSLAASPVGVNDTFPVTVVGNVSINSANLASPFSVTANDYLGLNPTATISAVEAVTTVSSNTISATSTQGGQVVMTVSGANIGKFTYDPPTGYEGTDTFTYTLSDNSNATSAVSNRQATVSITVSGMIWFIDVDAGLCTANGCGRLSNPFSTLAAFNSVNDGIDAGFVRHPANNDNIFIYESTNPYLDGIALRSGQKLIGQDATQSLSTITGLTPPTGSAALPAMNTGAPTAVIQSLAGSNNAVSAQTNVIPALIRGLSLDSFTTGGDSAIDITTSDATSGTLEISENVIVGAGAEGIDINRNGSGTLTLNVHNNTWNTSGTHGNAAGEHSFDARTTATGVLNLNFHDNTVMSSNAASSAVYVDGSGGGTLTVTGLANNSISGDAAGNGINVNTAIFDSNLGSAGYQAVSAGVTTIGASGHPVSGKGLLLAGGTNLKGYLDFSDMDIFSTAAALDVTAAGSANPSSSSGFLLTMASGVGTLNSNGGPAATIANATIDLPFVTITSANSSGVGVSLTGINDGSSVASTFSAGAGSSITNATSTDFLINSNNADVSYAGTISDNNGGQLVSMSSNTGGTKSFTDAISNTGASTGISLTNNSGTTMNFSGGLSISTGTNAAFTATGGGTLNVCDENPCNPGATGALNNTLTTSTGTALNVANTTIGSNNLEFRSISANGAANGIVLNTTGSSGGLKVKGTGSAGSGGTIQNSTASGVLLTSTSNASFSYMTIQTSNEDGIEGSSVTGLNLISTNVTNNGDDSEDVGVGVDNLWGTSTWTDVSVTQSELANVMIDNTSGTLDSWTISGSSHFDSLGTAFGGNSILVDIRGTAVMTAGSITGATFQNNKPARGITIQSQDTARIGDLAPGTTNFFVVQNNTFTNNGLHASFEQSGSANLYFKFLNNGTSLAPMTMPNTPSGTSHAVNVASSSTSTGGTIRGRIDGNFIGDNAVTGSGSANGNGLRVFIQGKTASTLVINNNVIRQTPVARGMDLQFVGQLSTGQAIIQHDLTLTNNNVNPSDTTGFPAAAIVVSADNQGSPARVRVNATGNNIPTYAVTGDYIDAHLILANVAAGAELQLVDTTAPISGTCSSELSGTNTGDSGTTGTCTLISGPITTAMVPASQVLAKASGDASVSEVTQNFTHSVRLSAPKTFTVAASHSVKLSKQAVWAKAPSTKLLGNTPTNGNDQLISAKLPAPAESGETVNVTGITTLPLGKSVKIVFRATVNGPMLPLGTTRILNQGTVTGSNFSSVNTTESPADASAACTAAPSIGTQTCTPVDRPDTTVTSITRSSGNPTTNPSVTWQVVFADPVDFLVASNFSLTSTGTVSGATLSVPTEASGPPSTTWNVTATGITGDGTLELKMVNDTGLSHDVTNLPYTQATNGAVFTIDNTPPTVTNITSSSNTGCLLNSGTTYCNAGDVVNIQITFSEVVNVTGTPQLALNSGGTASYVSGSGTSTLTFDYTVAGGENISNLEYNNINALTLNGGSIADAATNPATLTLPVPTASGSLSFNTDIVVDTTAPIATNFNRFNPSTTPTNANTLIWQAVFSETVTGVDSDGSDFTVPALTAPSISVGSGTTTYNVTVSGGNIANFNGTVDLNFVASPTIVDLAGNPLTNTTVGFDQQYVLDNTAPTVTINQKTSAPAQADPTGTSPINFTVVFSEAVDPTFVTGDVNLSTSTATGTLVGTVTEIAPNNGTTYNVAVTGMTGDGDVIASINSAVASDEAGNTNAASTSTDNSVTYDITQPTVTINQKTSAPAQSDPTGSSPINFTAVFSEPVSDFDDAADVNITGTAGATTILITGGPTTYNVAVSGMTGDGTVIVDIPAGAATDGLNLSAASTSTDNSVLYDTVAPSVTVNQKTSAPAQADPTSTDPINFTVTFSEDVTGFTNPATDVTISGTAASGTSASITGGPKVYNVAISGMSVNGTIIVDIPAGAAFDLASQPNDASTSTDHTVTFIPPADLSITKTDGVTTATPGGSVTYTITASNAGPNADPAAVVADTFPASLTVTWTCLGAGGGTCTASGSGNINDTVNLPVGGSVTYTASATISAAATGTLSNTATVSTSAGVFDGTSANNSATDTDTLAPSADVAITKTDGVTNAVPGGSVTYTITASNAGPSNTSATVADTFPAILTVNWTCVGAGGGTCTASGSGNINDSVNLPAGGSVTYTASATISASATGTMANTATVSSVATDPNPGNNAATDTDTLTPQADLSITKTDGVAVVIPGGSTTYTITASNAGLSNAPGSTVADTFPATLTANWTCVGAGGGTCTASGSGNISDTVNLPAGGSVTYTVSATISGAASGSIANTATVSAPGGVTDPSPANNSATDIDTVVPPVAVTINQKTSAPAQADPTNAVSINFTVVFGSAVTDFDDASDVTLGGTAGPTTVVITGGPTTYNVAVSGQTGFGTVTATIPAGVALGSLGQPNAASTSTDNDVTYDGVAPDTIIDTTPANPTTSTNPTFAFHGDDGTGVGVSGTGYECQLDGGGFSGCSSPRSYTVAEGSHTFMVRAIDDVGNVDPTPASFTWVVDTTAPNTIIDTNPTNPSNSATGNFTFHGTDSGSGISSVECKLDSGGFAACDTITSHAFTSLSDGSHTVQIRAIDNAGNVDVSPASYTWTVDTVAPTTNILTNPTNPTASTSAAFTFDGADTGGTGVTGFQCQLDGGGYSACNSGSKNYTSLADGSHTFDVRAVDAAGNADATPDSYTWVVDATAPNTTITSTNGLGALTNSTNATFDFTGNDGSGVGGLTFQCKLDSGSFTTCTSPQSYSSLTNGSHTFQVRATDSLGNVDASPDSFTWTVDIVSPTVIVSSVTTSPTNISPITVTITFSEAVTGFTPSVAAGDIVIGGVGGTDSNPTGSGTTYSFDLTPSGQGAVTVTVPAGSAVDAASNQNTVSNTFSITYDTVAPTVTIDQKTTSPAQADPTSISPIKFTVIFSETVIGFTSADITLSGTANPTTAVITGSGPTYTVAVSGMSASGTVIADVKKSGVTDTAGNLNDASTSTDNTVTFNNTPLTVSIDQAATQTDPDFADSASKKIHFTAVFSEPVTGFTGSDVSFAGTTLMGTLTASVTQIAPMDGTTYDVGVKGMLPKGTVFVSIPANKATSISRGVGNQASTSTDNNIIVDYVLVEFISTDVKDGWVLESTETSGVGGSLDSTATTSKVGDDANDKQYRSVLDFATGSLPDSAIFFSVNLRIIEHSITGTNPFTTHGLLKSDIKSGFFGSAGALQNPDFEDTADKSACNFESVPEILESIGTAYRCIFFEAAYPHINVTGSTQLRLRFATDDNDDMSADTFNFYSGDYGGSSQRPRLFIKYYIAPAP